jgi:hypothetical protein
MSSVSDKSCRENKKNIFCVQELYLENRAVYEIMWQNMVEPDWPQRTMWRVYIACWIPKAANTHSKYVIFIAFALEQWLYERTSLLR